MLEGLEKDLKAVRKARETLGDAAPKFGSGPRRDGDSRGRGGGNLGKRKRDEDESSEGEDVPEGVKRIPMPRDTPPPIPREVLDKWYQKRRERLAQNNPGRGTNANTMPLGENERRVGRPGGMPERQISTAPAIEAKTTYEAKPVIRDLRKEAVAFVPAAVRAKLDKSKGVGGLVEPEEMDQLEKAGYMTTNRTSTGKEGRQLGVTEGEDQSDPSQQASRRVEMEEVEDEDG